MKIDKLGLVSIGLTLVSVAASVANTLVGKEQQNKKIEEEVAKFINDKK